MKELTYKIIRPDSDIYRFAPLDKYSFRQRVLIHLADRTFHAILKLLGATLRYEAADPEIAAEVLADSAAPIPVFWHDRLFMAAHLWRGSGYAVLVSRSFDGEYIARAAQRLGYGAIRGSSTRGGAAALGQAVDAALAGVPVVFMIDGPKGPRYEAKMGACLLAKKTQNPICPIIIEPEKFWTVKSWDRLRIPKPFTRAAIFVGKPIRVSPDADEAELEEKRLEVQKSLNELVARGENWRRGGRN